MYPLNQLHAWLFGFFNWKWYSLKTLKTTNLKLHNYNHMTQLNDWLFGIFNTKWYGPKTLEKQPTSNFIITIIMTKLLHAWLFGIFSWKVAWGCKEFWDYFFPVKSKSFSVVLPPHLLLYFRRDFRWYPYPWSLRGSRLQFKSCPPIIWSFHSKMVIIDRVIAFKL